MTAKGGHHRAIGEVIELIGGYLTRILLLPFLVTRQKFCLKLLQQLFVSKRVCVHIFDHFRVHDTLIRVNTIYQVVREPESKNTAATSTPLAVHKVVFGDLLLAYLLCDRLKRVIVLHPVMLVWSLLVWLYFLKIERLDDFIIIKVYFVQVFRRSFSTAPLVMIHNFVFIE